MAEALTPSAVLEEYDIVGREVPTSVINKMRGRFAALEIEGVGSWKMLCDEVTDLDAKKKIDQDRLYVAQACAEVLSEKIGHVKYRDGISWKDRLIQLETKEDFLHLFAILGIQNNEWQISSWLANNGYTNLYLTIMKDDRFKNSWDAFKIFMSVEVKGTMTSRIANCTTPNDFLVLFKEEGIEGDDWQNSKWLTRNDHGDICAAIYSDARFDSWDAFKKFMSVEVMEIMPVRVAQCITSDDFLALFREEGIKVGDNWQNSRWLADNGHVHLYTIIKRDPRFDSWKTFLIFMREEVQESWVEKVTSCKTASDFRELFKREGLSEDEWKSSGWLQRNSFAGLYAAITRNRFDSWKTFLTFMGEEVQESWVEKVASCKTASDFRTLFKCEGIPGKEWQSSRWMVGHYSGLYIAIYNRFGSWESFLTLMDPEAVLEDEEMAKLAELSVEDAIALLGKRDPYKLKVFLQFAHPELTEEEINKLVRRAFRNFVIGRNETREQEYMKYSEELPDVTIKRHPVETDKPTVTIRGKAEGEFVYFTGCYTRRIRLDESGTFSICIPLKQGEENEIRVMAVDTRDNDHKVRSFQYIFQTEQTTKEEDDVETLIKIIDEHSKTVRSDIQKNPGRLEYFKQCAEQVLIKKFSRSFEEGEEYVQDLIDQVDSETIRRVLRSVLAKFRRINRMKIENVREGSLLFFQRYCVAEIRNRMENPDCPGVILANDPGLGKTRTVEAAVADMEAGIFCPNSVVSAWEEEANEVLADPDMLVMRNVNHRIRKEMLRTRRKAKGVMSPQRYVTNIEFLQKVDDEERFKLLGSRKMVAVHDEAHSRVNEQTEQSKGAQMVAHQFQINVTATPAKNPEAVRRLLRTMHPKDKRFKSAAAFAKAFPSNDPKALKTLNLIMSRDMIRFRKDDVLEEIDPKRSLKNQRHRIPKKNAIDSEDLGEFTMRTKQAEAIYKMFINWHDWTKEYDKYIPDDKTAEEDRLRVAGALTKKHALRQAINNPGYIGLDEPDMKARQARGIVNDCLKQGRKVVIFCAYNAQALKYAEMFKKHNPALYTGITSDKGEKKDENGKAIRFAREEEGNGNGRKRGWKFDAEGYPVEDPNGNTMSALDYERLTFQNADDRQLIIATYKAGAVGTTFTAGKAMIFDDLPTDVVEAIQAEDRIHRIDPDRQTHATVEYYNLVSKYPPRFLARMKKIWVVKDREEKCYKEFKTKNAADRFARKEANRLDRETPEDVETAYDAFFAQGTYDQVHTQNLVTQRHMFHLINDGIADSTILREDQIGFRGFEINGASEALAI